jgi:dienelactone hydrolase
VRFAKEKARHVFRSGDGGSEDRQARYAISHRFLEPLRALAERGVPMSIIYGDADHFLVDFERARAGLLEPVLKAGRDVELTVIPGKVHGFMSVEVQDKVLDLITDRLIRLPR